MNKDSWDDLWDIATSEPNVRIEPTDTPHEVVLYYEDGSRAVLKFNLQMREWRFCVAGGASDHATATGMYDRD